MRDLLARAATDGHAAEAVELFCYLAKKFLGALAAVLGGLDALVFTAGIGENAPVVREKFCAGMEWCGLSLDKNKNGSAIGAESLISSAGARVCAYVIPSDEEAIIARETVKLFQRKTR